MPSFRPLALLVLLAVVLLPAAPTHALDPYFPEVVYDDAVPTPAEVIGHEIGEHFTRHDALLRYCEAVAEASDRVALVRYGQTHQRRSLVALVVTSPDNHERLEEILADNRALADPRGTDAARAGRIVETNPAIAWLSYNVHGNEASCTEAAVRVLHELAAGDHERIDRILRDVVVVIDPCLNPDGRERYIQGYEARRGTQLDPLPIAAEHREPWPSGRPNHYLFDLNRDWVWLVQVESRQRLPLYRRFLPQLHVDYHEQGYHSPYFFGAGDTPYNANIPAESKRWFDLYGRASARTFDERGLVYATKERFDYLYPGYGKVLPCYHGAVGLLCEQAGHGRAGLAIDVGPEPGYQLTLADRTHHHVLTSLTYLETTAEQRRAQLDRFRRFFAAGLEVSEGTPAAFAVSTRTDPQRLALLADLCRAHGIEIHELTRPARVGDARSYHPGAGPAEGESVELDAGTLVIPAAQPMGALARALFERDTFVEDPDTYDITSWPVPVMFGLDAVEIHGDVGSLPLRRVAEDPARRVPAPPDPGSEGVVALLVDADQHRFPEAVALAGAHGVFGRLAGDEIAFADDETMLGVRVAAGSLLLHASRNDPDALRRYTEALHERDIAVEVTTAGYAASGPALGNNANRRLVAPRIAVARGDTLSSLSFGQVWHLLDVEAGVPHSVIDMTDLDGLDVDDHNVLVLASGRPTREAGEAIEAWVRDGGTLVAIGRGARWSCSTLLDLDDDENLPEIESDDPEGHAMTYAERRRRGVSRRVPGPVLSIAVDTGHPLMAGVPERVGVHVRSDGPMPVADEGIVLARFAGTPGEVGGTRIGGVLPEQAERKLAGTPFATWHRLGRGGVVCIAHDPTIRGFNHAGMRLLLNTVTLGPSSSPALQPLGE